MHYEELISIINEEFPENIVDFVEVLELHRIVIDNTLKLIRDKVDYSFEFKDFEKSYYYLTLANNISVYDNKIKDIILSLDIEENQSFNEDDVMYKKLCEDNKTFKSSDDSKHEYSLYEDFINTKPAGFKLNYNEIIPVNTWKELLIKICEYLIEIDEERFMNFENLEHMNGKKRKNFCTNSKELRNPKTIKNKIYIETNKSANSIRDILRNILLEYDYKITDLKIYLRSEYTDLNINEK